MLKTYDDDGQKLWHTDLNGLNQSREALELERDMLRRRLAETVGENIRLKETIRDLINAKEREVSHLIRELNRVQGQGLRVAP